VKHHKWFAKVHWGLLRNSTPPIVPLASNGIDAMNFRTMRDSQSLDLETQVIHTVAGRSIPGTPGLNEPDGMELGRGNSQEDLFHGFSSITLHHDGDR